MFVTLTEAFAQLIGSPEYLAKSKGQESEPKKYRTYASRFRAGTLKAGAMVEMLQAHGYSISAKRQKLKGK